MLRLSANEYYGSHSQEMLERMRLLSPGPAAGYRTVCRGLHS